MNVRRALTCLAVLLAAPSADARLASEYQAPEVRFVGRTVTLPFVMIREFPFVDGSVAGVRGKFLLDTGSQPAMTLNDHRLSLAGGVSIGKGHFGSGQTFNVMMRPMARDVNVGGLHFDTVTKVSSQDARLLEGITPDFIGWIGYQAWAPYAMKLDYQASKAIFYKAGPEEFLAGETVLGKLPYEKRKLPNHPIFKGTVGTTSLAVSLDSGQWGNIYIDAKTRDRWIKEGHLIAQGDDRYDLKGLKLGDSFVVSAPKLHLSTTTAPFAEPLGITEPAVISLGYSVLGQYTTVWDFPRQVFYFLKLPPAKGPSHHV